MEKKQLSVDDDLLPIYYVHSEVEGKTFSRGWQEHEASVPSPQFNHFPSFNNCLAPSPPRADRSVFNQHDHEGQKEAQTVFSSSGTNIEDSCTSNAYSRLPRVSDFQQSHKATSMNTQSSSTSNIKSAQDVFLASLLQAQLCVMDLQDQIEITETNHKAREIGAKMSTTLGLDITPSLILEPQTRPFSEEIVRDEEAPVEDEDQESDDTAYSELEVEDERLFCDNPLFKNSEVSHNVAYNIQTSVTKLTSQHELSPMDRIVNDRSQLLKQNAWDSRDSGTGTAAWHQIIREDSLEELQIYEDEWEEKRSVLSTTRTTRWTASDNLPCTQENPLSTEDPPARTAMTCSVPDIPVTLAPFKEEKSCLLFTDSSYWTNFLTQDLEPEHEVLTSCIQESTSPHQDHRKEILLDLRQGEGPQSSHEEPGEGSLLDLFQYEGVPPPQVESREEIMFTQYQSMETQASHELHGVDILLNLYQGTASKPPCELHNKESLLDLCQGTGAQPPSKLHRKDLLLDVCQGSGFQTPSELHWEDILLNLCQGTGAQPPRELPNEEILLDVCQGSGFQTPSELHREDILLNLCQGTGAQPPRELPNEEILLDVCQGSGFQTPSELHREDILLNLCQGTGAQPPRQLHNKEIVCPGEGTHPVCQGCQGKEHGSKIPPSMSASETLQSKEKQETPEIIIEQFDDVSTDLETSGSEEVTYVEAVANAQDVEAARCLAMKLFHLDGFDRSQVAPYIQKNNDFSAMVAEEYLALFDFKGKTLDVALRSLLQELVLTGETQERERVLYHFSKRFHSCNPAEYGSADAVHTLTCALMLLNSDLHGQNIGKSMTAQDFINNLEGMNDGGNFPRELLKGLYNSIRTEKLEWAMSEEKLANILVAKPENLLSVRKKSNPFVDLPAQDPQAPVYKQGMLCRKVHADIDGKKTPWGKRRWKSFHTVLKGMLLFFLKDEYKADFQFPEEVISVHHALAERASDYTKRPNVFRLQTADWRVFLFQTQTSEEMNSWIYRINLVAAMFSSPPFAAAVGSQRRFYRPILPSAQSKLDLEEQLQSHESLMDRFTDDLTEHQRNLPDPKSKSRESEDYHLREEYLRYEKLRYETYVKLLAVRLESGCEDLQVFESRLTEPDDVQGETAGLKRSYSSPSLNPESSSVVVKVKRNISERRTYRRIIPKRNKNLV